MHAVAEQSQMLNTLEPLFRVTSCVDVRSVMELVIQFKLKECDITLYDLYMKTHTLKLLL
jgi:hypothetical protein